MHIVMNLHSQRNPSGLAAAAVHEELFEWIFMTWEREVELGGNNRPSSHTELNFKGISQIFYLTVV